MNSQVSAWRIAYVLTASGMLVGLLLMRADGRAYWRWPVYSAMAMVLGVVCGRCCASTCFRRSGKSRERRRCISAR